MHLVASDQYLYCQELRPASCDSINVDLSVAELLAAGAYGYVAFVAYDVEGITGVEFALDGWPSGRGAPTLTGPTWCEDALSLGDHGDGGGITVFEACVEPDSSSGMAILAYWTFGPLDSTDLPIDLNIIASTYSDADSLLIVLDCTVEYEEDDVVAVSGCTIGGAHSGTAPDCSGGQEGGTEGGGEGTGHGSCVPGELIVRFEEGEVLLPEETYQAPIEDVAITSQQVMEMCQSIGVSDIEQVFRDWSPADTVALSRTGELVRLIDLSDVYKLYIPEGSDVSALATRMEDLEAVEYAEPNYVCRGTEVPDDPYFADQWGLHQASSDVDIDAPEAWNRTTGSDDIIIAILDTGVDYNHDDLGRVLGPYPIYQYENLLRDATYEVTVGYLGCTLNTICQSLYADTQLLHPNVCILYEDGYVVMGPYEIDSEMYSDGEFQLVFKYTGEEREVTQEGVSWILVEESLPWYVDVAVGEGGRMGEPELGLRQDYPNPFNPRTTIDYVLPMRTHVTVEVFNVLGQKIVALVDESQPAGEHKVDWVAHDVPSGVYFLRLEAAEHTLTRKMVLLE